MEYTNLRESYTNFLIKSINNVGREFYKIKTTYAYIVRERFFCYELYHQMRLLQEENMLEKENELKERIKLSSLSLSAEIDKSGHRDIKKQDQRNPDFVFHQYGSFKNNEIIIEVKGDLHGQGCKKDFRTLNLYCSPPYNYKYGFFILYNHGFDEFSEKTSDWFKSAQFKKMNIKKDITIICKKDFDSECEVTTLEKLLCSIDK